MSHVPNPQQPPNLVPFPRGGSQPKLLDRVRQTIRTRHYSPRTEEAYVHWIRRYIVFHGKKHPSTMGAPDISTFLTWLAVERRVSASTQNQALSAVLFLYKHVLGIEIGAVPSAVRARTPERLPVVLSREEIAAILKHPTIRAAVAVPSARVRGAEGDGRSDAAGGHHEARESTCDAPQFRDRVAGKRL